MNTAHSFFTSTMIILAFYVARSFISVFTAALQFILILSQINPSTLSHHISLRSNLVSPSHLSLSLPSGFFPSGFPAKILFIFLLCLIHAKCPAHLIILQYLHTLGRLFQIRNASCWTSGISTAREQLIHNSWGLTWRQQTLLDLAKMEVHNKITAKFRSQF